MCVAGRAGSLSALPWGASLGGCKAPGYDRGSKCFPSTTTFSPTASPDQSMRHVHPRRQPPPAAA